jgi:hypothetical protein
MKVEKTIEENFKEISLNAERGGFLKAFYGMLFIIFIMVAYFIQYRNSIEFDKQVNKCLYEKLASDCQMKIDSMKASELRQIFKK